MYEKACPLDSAGIWIPFHAGTTNFSCFQTFSDLLWGPPILLPIGMGALPPRIRRWIVNLTTHFYLFLLLSTSINGGTAPPSGANSLYGPEKTHIYHSSTLNSGRIFNVYNNTSPNSIIYLNINQLDSLQFLMSLFHASTYFEHHVLIVKRSKLYYRASGIITLVGGRPVRRLREDSLNLCCIIRFWPPDDEHMVLEICRGMK